MVKMQDVDGIGWDEYHGHGLRIGKADQAITFGSGFLKDCKHRFQQVSSGEAMNHIRESNDSAIML